MHVVMVTMQDSTQMMSIHIVNTDPKVAVQLLHLGAVYTAEAGEPDALRRAH